jgi:hypothetical protein
MKMLLKALYGSVLTAAWKFAADRGILPTWMGTAELAELEAGIKDRAVFSARTTHAVYLQDLHDRIKRYIENGYDGDQAKLRLELKQIITELGYDPEKGFPGDERLGIPPARAGSLQDLSSDKRINLILDTQLELMAGKGQEQRGLSPEALDLFPAWELVRLKTARVPRDWFARWKQAGGRVLEDADGRKRLVAHKLDEVWSVLGDSAIFKDALSVSHPPFAFGSGMGWMEIEQDEYTALLNSTPGVSPAPPPARPNVVSLPAAQISTEGLSRATIERLTAKLKGIESASGKLTLKSIINEAPPPPPPARLRRLNALCDELLCVALVVEVNGKARKARRAEQRAKLPGQKCGGTWIPAWKECHQGKAVEMSRDKAVKLLSSDEEMTAEQMASAMKAAPGHHQSERLAAWFGKGYKDINSHPGSKDSVELVKMLRRVKPEQRTQPLFRGEGHNSPQEREDWFASVQSNGGVTLKQPVTATTQKTGVAKAFARGKKQPVFWTIERPQSARNLHPAAVALGSDKEHQEERAFLPDTQLKLKSAELVDRDGKSWLLVAFEEGQTIKAGSPK